MTRWFRSKRAGQDGGTRSTPPRLAPAKTPADDWRSYDEVAADYERVHAPLTRQPAADLLALAGARAGERVLDVGAGTAVGVELAGRSVSPGGLAIGVDPAVEMLVVARRARPGALVAGAEAINLPFREATFDVVTANFTLAYFTKLDTGLFDLVRVLRPGGRLAASAWAAGEDELTRTWRQLAEEAVGREILTTGLADEAPWAKRLSDAARLEATLRDSGLRPVRVERREYRMSLSREDYLVGQETEAAGRFVRMMLGPALWESFRERARRAFAERFPEQLVDLRDVLLGVGTKP
jgi:ubiquinone/menaquinone biosynthesis C-methylase UbiE